MSEPGGRLTPDEIAAASLEAIRGRVVLSVIVPARVPPAAVRELVLAIEEMIEALEALWPDEP